MSFEDRMDKSIAPSSDGELAPPARPLSVSLVADPLLSFAEQTSNPEQLAHAVKLSLLFSFNTSAGRITISSTEAPIPPSHQPHTLSASPPPSSYIPRRDARRVLWRGVTPSSSPSTIPHPLGIDPHHPPFESFPLPFFSASFAMAVYMDSSRNDRERE